MTGCMGPVTAMGIFLFETTDENLRAFLSGCFAEYSRRRFRIDSKHYTCSGKWFEIGILMKGCHPDSIGNYRSLRRFCWICLQCELERSMKVLFITHLPVWLITEIVRTSDLLQYMHYYIFSHHTRVSMNYYDSIVIVLVVENLLVFSSFPFLDATLIHAQSCPGWRYAPFVTGFFPSSPAVDSDAFTYR